MSPKKTVSCQEHYQAGFNFAIDEKDTLNGNITSSPITLVPPKEDFSRKRCKQADEQVAKDIEYILNADPFAAEPY